MAYFLKKSNLKKGTYLQIYESFRDPVTKTPKNKSFKALGYVDELIAGGIENPIEHFSAEVDKLNKARKKEKAAEKNLKITNSSDKNVGYFLLKAVLNKLKVLDDVKYLNLMRDFEFDVAELLEALIYSRVVSPCSKLKTWKEIIPSLYENFDFSIDQIYEGVEFIGSEYEKIIEAFNKGIKKAYGRKTSKVYFDCTNYYFEIDCEKEDKQKGPSKENRTSPIIGMALMLDENQIPIAMKMYPGNQSEKPLLRNTIADMKKRNCITGKTIQIADKGLNCAENIASAVLAGDGYIFSKSVKQLPDKEKEFILTKKGYVNVLDSDGTIKYSYKEFTDDFPYNITDMHGKKKTVMLPEKRIATFNPKLAEKQLFEINKLMDKATNLTKAKAKKSDFGECAKYVDFVSVNKSTGVVSDGDEVIPILNTAKYEKDKILAGYNLLVTSETKMSALEIYSAYHNLWKIEESFHVLKSQLDARPVYLSKQNSIYGHFLVCYLSVVLLRLLELKEFRSELNYNQIIDFISGFRFLPIKQKKTIVNIATLDKVQPINDRLNLNLTNYYFSDAQINSLLKFSF